ncbi:MAG: hypothetical protein WBP89_19735 [Sedimenticolaceae bacterium]
MSKLILDRKSRFQNKQWHSDNAEGTQIALRTNTTPAAGHWVVASLCEQAAL